MDWLDCEISISLPNNFDISNLDLFFYNNGFMYHYYSRIYLKDLKISL